MNDSRDHNAKLMSLAVHELRTPVAVVGGYLRMVLKHFGENLTEQQQKLLKEAEKSCGTLGRLLGDLGELAHIEDGRAVVRREPTAIFRLLDEVASTVHTDDDRGVTLEVRGGNPDVQVLGDPDRLRSVLASLITAVLRERVEPGPVLAVGNVVTTANGTSAVLAIGDPDQAPALVAQVPEPSCFDQYRGGLGFQLPLAVAIVSALGGRLASPVEERGHLAIVLSLPVVTQSESTA